MSTYIKTLEDFKDWVSFMEKLSELKVFHLNLHCETIEREVAEKTSLEGEVAEVTQVTEATQVPVAHDADDADEMDAVNSSESTFVIDMEDYDRQLPAWWTSKMDDMYNVGLISESIDSGLGGSYVKDCIIEIKDEYSKSRRFSLTINTFDYHGSFKEWRESMAEKVFSEKSSKSGNWMQDYGYQTTLTICLKLIN